MLAMLQEAGDYVSIQHLMKVYRISKRTVYYDMDKINHWLKVNRLEPVRYVRDAGFLLPESSRSQLPTKMKNVQPAHYNLSRKERSAWLGIFLMTATEAVFLHHLEDVLKVSRGTAHKELKKVEEQLASLNLQLEFSRKKGYHVIGAETDKRKALANYLSQVISQVSWKDFVTQIQGLVNANLSQTKLPLLRENHLSLIYDIIMSGEKVTGMELTDETVHSLASRLMIYTNRLMQGQSVTMDQDEKEALQKTASYPVARQIADELGQLFGIVFPEDEVCYITMHLLGARVNRMEEGALDNETLKIQTATRRMIDTFERIGCVYFHNREQMERQLFLHAKPAFYRIKYGLNIDNPMTDTVKMKYREVFDLTRRAVEPLQDLLDNPFSEGEIAYLAMHFGGWLRREKVQPVSRQKAAIVCVNGISASRMLKLQLEQLFPALDWAAVLSLRDYEKFAEKVDFIFSTVPLSDNDIPVFVVSPILTETEKANLLHQVNHTVNPNGSTNPSQGSAQAIVQMVKQHADVRNERALHDDISRYLAKIKSSPADDPKLSLENLLTQETITLASRVDDWASAIRLAAQPLLQRGDIIPRYINAMIDKVKERGPYIVVAPGIAIAHARPEDGVIRTSFAMLKLSDAVQFGPEIKHEVRIVFVLASDDGQSHLGPLSQLTVLLRDKNNRGILEETNDIDSIRQLFQTRANTTY